MSYLPKLDDIEALECLLARWVLEKSASPGAIQTLRDLIDRMKAERGRSEPSGV